jgi:Uma2 family endonuclease
MKKKFIATTFYRLLNRHQNGTKRIARGFAEKGLPKLRSTRDNNQLLLSGAGFCSGKPLLSIPPVAGRSRCTAVFVAPSQRRHQNTDWQRAVTWMGKNPLAQETMPAVPQGQLTQKCVLAGHARVNWELIMATTTHIPIEVYLRSSYEPDAEYVDGVIEERAVGEYDHAAWQEAICYWFRQHGHDWNVRVKPELRIQVAPTRFRVPDVTVLDRVQSIEQIVTHPPVAVFEILSPEDTMQRLKRKLEDYRIMGIPEVWVIDPQDGAYYRYEDRQLLRRDSFSYAEKRIVFEMDRIKDQLD